MIKNATIQARINGNLKKKAEKILGKIGISHSEAINIFYSQLTMQNGLPFEVKIPNKETLSAIKDTIERKNLKKYRSVTDLYEEIRKI